MKYGRTYFSALVQLITGHNFLNRHNSIVELGEVDINLAKCSYCDDNEAEESTAHILSQCDAFAAKRLQIFGVPYFSPEEFAFKKASNLSHFYKRSTWMLLRIYSTTKPTLNTPGITVNSTLCHVINFSV